MGPVFHLVTRRLSVLLDAVVRRFAGGARMSLEGDLSRSGLRALPESTQLPTPILRRQALDATHPDGDFVIVPLEPETVDAVLSDLLNRAGLRSRVIHIQIEREGRLVFGAFDQFHEECVWIDAGVGTEFIDGLVARGAIWSYAAAGTEPADRP